MPSFRYMIVHMYIPLTLYTGFEQIVPHSPLIQTHELSSLHVDLFQVRKNVETNESCTTKESVNHTTGEVPETKGDVNWFDLLSADNIFAHREE